MMMMMMMMMQPLERAASCLLWSRRR